MRNFQNEGGYENLRDDFDREDNPWSRGAAFQSDVVLPPEGEGPFEIIPRNGQFLVPPNVVCSVYLLYFGIHEQVVFQQFPQTLQLTKYERLQIFYPIKKAN